MQIVTNEKAIDRGKKIGRIATTAGTILLGVGFVVSVYILLQAGRAGADPTIYMRWQFISYVLVVLGFIISSIGNYNLGKWAAAPRAHEILSRVLRGLDDRYYLFNYLPPVEHLLQTPQGLVVLLARKQSGTIYCDGDKWRQRLSFGRWFRTLGQSGLGQPPRELEQDVERVRKFLAQHFSQESIPVTGAVAFIHPRVELQLRNPTVPALPVKDLRPYIEGLREGEKALHRSLQRKLAETLIEGLKG